MMDGGEKEYILINRENHNPDERRRIITIRIMSSNPWIKHVHKFIKCTNYHVSSFETSTM